MDLLTEAKEQAERYTRHLRFDVEMLAERQIFDLLRSARSITGNGKTISE